MRQNYDDPRTAQMNKHRRMKPGERMPARDGHEAYVAQVDVHDVVRDREEMRAAVIKEEYDRWGKQEGVLLSEEGAFGAGFNAGEQHGHTVGFSRGADLSVRQLTHSKGKGRTRELASGNWLGEPETKLEAINAEQLTAEICALLAAYAIVPTDHKVGAVIDALNTLPGVDLRFGPRPDPNEDKQL